MIDRRVALLGGGAFVVAADATLVVGLLQQMARSLSVSPTAGQAVTVWVAAYALLTPVLPAELHRRPDPVRRNATRSGNRAARALLWDVPRYLVEMKQRGADC